MSDGRRAGRTHQKTAEEIYSAIAVTRQGVAGIFVALAIGGWARSREDRIEDEVRKYPA